MKTYIKCTVTDYSGNIKIVNVGLSGFELIPLALNNKSVLIEETICSKEEYNKLNFYKID